MHKHPGSLIEADIHPLGEVSHVLLLLRGKWKPDPHPSGLLIITVVLLNEFKALSLQDKLPEDKNQTGITVATGLLKPGIFQIPQLTSVYFHKEIQLLPTKELLRHEITKTGTAVTDYPGTFTPIIIVAVTAITTIMTVTTVIMEMFMVAGQDLCMEHAIR